MVVNPTFSQFAIGYGQIALGGKIEQDVLTKLITIILEKARPQYLFDLI